MRLSGVRPGAGHQMVNRHMWSATPTGSRETWPQGAAGAGYALSAKRLQRGCGVEPGMRGHRLETAISRIRRWLLAAALLLGAVLPSQGWADEGTEITRRYYAISGRSRAELLASVRRNAPRAGSAYGIGFIDFHPRYTLAPIAEGCRVDTATVGLRIVLRLPRWNGAKDAPRAVKRLAARFERAITAHEMQHVRIAKHHARRMARQIARLKPAENCWRLRRAAQAVIARHKKAHRASQAAFDRRTRKAIKRLL